MSAPFAPRFTRLFRRAAGSAPLVCTAMLMLGFGAYVRQQVLIFLPGTQPGTVSPADAVTTCQGCHSSTSPSRPVIIYKEWAGSMMAHSARDPVFYAALVVANKYNGVTGNTTGEWCIRCHSPMGWLAGHSEDYTGRSLVGTDLDGVQCDYCHRTVDPLHPDSTVPYMTFPVPGYGNGMHVVQQLPIPKRGPFDSLAGPHPTKFDPFQQSSELCGICHDVSNVYYALDRINQAPHQFAPLERTYSEWLLSAYSSEGEAGTCQSCHMRDTTGFICVYLSSAEKTYGRHDLTGGNTFVPDILPDFWTGLDTAILGLGKQRATAMLREAAGFRIDAYRSGGAVVAKVRIINNTGHKLPTGYPDGRRMWIYLLGTNAHGDTLFQSGVYDADSARLIRDPQAKVYEMIQGITPSRAASYGLSSGASLHFSLNDTILFDNRIPPRGFTNIGYRQRLAQPVAAAYADSQYWDVTQYALDSSVTQVTGILYYQTISREYVEFLRDQTAGDSTDWNQWGEKLYNAWFLRGKAQPVAMNTLTIPVSDTVTSVDGHPPAGWPATPELAQNYPNPFNPTTSVSFSIGKPGSVTIRVYDVIGREVATLVDREMAAGTHSVQFDGSALSSGIYYYTLRAGGIVRVKKMLLVR